jgi:lauroyl/myristoyl acyltransferase
VKPRHILSWKFFFYQLVVPVLRRLGPGRCDLALGGLGRLIAAVWPPSRRALDAAVARARTGLPTVGDRAALRPRLAANWARFVARDCPLDAARDDQVLARFAVRGFEDLRNTLDAGRGAIIVGSHLGGHVAALHWLYRRGVPLRLLVQRPRHVSHELDRWFDRAAPHPQAEFFLSRGLSPEQAAERMLRARAALRDGLAVYLTGDIPWSGPNARSGCLLGQSLSFLSVWTDLAVLTRAPVFLLFCTHRPGGRFAVTIGPPWALAPGEEDDAVALYLARLETEIAAYPADAVAHLLWPCYGPPSPAHVPAHRPSRRVAAVSHS